MSSKMSGGVGLFGVREEAMGVADDAGGVAGDVDTNLIVAVAGLQRVSRNIHEDFGSIARTPLAARDVGLDIPLLQRVHDEFGEACRRIDPNEFGMARDAVSGVTAGDQFYMEMMIADYRANDKFILGLLEAANVFGKILTALGEISVSARTSRITTHINLIANVVDSLKDIRETMFEIEKSRVPLKESMGKVESSMSSFARGSADYIPLKRADEHSVEKTCGKYVGALTKLGVTLSSMDTLDKFYAQST
jgi:hypothetical protein